MAGRGLGTLTLDLAIKIGGFTAGLDKAGRELDKKSKQMQKNAEKFGRDLGIALKVGLGLAATGLGIYIKNTIEAEKVQAQLTARIKDTGMAAGRSLEQLNAQAEKLQSLTVFDDESIGEAQAALMRFTQVTGEQFDRAIESATDLATAMGTDLPAAATLLGKALSDPEKGMVALKRAGVVLTDDQKALAKELQKTGDLAGAQGVILDALAGTMGSAAEAARNTLGGALQGLQNSFNNLLEGDGGSAGVREATTAINEFSATLNSPEARQGIDAIITGLVKLAGWVGTAADAFVKGAQQIGNSFAFIAQNGALLGDFAKGGLIGGLAGASDKLKTLRDSYKQFVEETKRTRGDFAGTPAGAPIIFEDPPGPRGKRPEEGAAARAKAAADAAKNATRGASEAKREAAEAARRQADAEDALRESIEKTQKASAEFTQQMEDLRVVGDPLAEATLSYNRELADLRKLAGEGETAATDLAEAERILGEQYADNTAKIRERLDTGGQQLIQMQNELDLLNLQTQAERDRAAFLLDNPTATGDQADAAASIRAQIDETHRAIAATDDLRASFEDAFINLPKDGIDAIKQFADNFVQQLIRMAAQAASTSLFGEPGTTGGGSLGGWFSKLLGFLPKHASGTLSAPGGMSWVGERGPELVNLPRGAQVYPADQSRRMAGGNVNTTMIFQVPMTERTIDQAAKKTATVQRRAMLRNGRVPA